jgi:hypothetical protein
MKLTINISLLAIAMGAQKKYGNLTVEIGCTILIIWNCALKILIAMN